MVPSHESSNFSCEGLARETRITSIIAQCNEQSQGIFGSGNSPSLVLVSSLARENVAKTHYVFVLCRVRASGQVRTIGTRYYIGRGLMFVAFT